VWPRAGANPVDAASKSDYFDSIFHAAAAIGINTTAQIEAGIIGRPVYSIRAPQFSGTQEGSLHFQYLLKESGGLVRLDQDLDAHTRALADALDANQTRNSGCATSCTASCARMVSTCRRRRGSRTTSSRWRGSKRRRR
jgi:hypothetical protein